VVCDGRSAGCCCCCLLLVLSSVKFSALPLELLRTGGVDRGKKVDFLAPPPMNGETSEEEEEVPPFSVDTFWFPAATMTPPLEVGEATTALVALCFLYVSVALSLLSRNFSCSSLLGDASGLLLPLLFELISGVVIAFAALSCPSFTLDGGFKRLPPPPPRMPTSAPLPAALPYDFALGEEVDATCDGEGWLNLSRVAPNLLLLLLEEDNDASPGLIISAALSELLFIRTTSRPPPAPPMTPDEAVACCWALRARRLARMACSSDIVYLYCDLKMVHRWHGQRKTDRCVVSCFQLWHRLAPYRTEHENGRREDAANVVLALRLSLPSCIGPCRDVVVLYGKGGNGGGGIQFGWIQAVAPVGGQTT
jgi:hypothetical protein